MDKRIHAIAELRSNNIRDSFPLWYGRNSWTSNFAMRFIIVRTINLDMASFISKADLKDDLLVDLNIIKPEFLNILYDIYCKVSPEDNIFSLFPILDMRQDRLMELRSTTGTNFSKFIMSEEELNSLIEDTNNNHSQDMANSKQRSVDENTDNLDKDSRDAPSKNKSKKRQQPEPEQKKNTRGQKDDQEIYEPVRNTKQQQQHNQPSYSTQQNTQKGGGSTNQTQENGSFHNQQGRRDHGGKEKVGLD